MGRVRTRWLFAVCMAAAVSGTGRETAAQALVIDAALNQSFTSVDPLTSPMGLSVSVGGVGLWGPMGFHASYRDVREDVGEVAQSCGPSSCVSGPFDQSYSMKTVGFGISYDFVNPTDVMLTLGLNGASNWQVEGLTHLQTGERSGNSTGSNYSLGVSADLRLRPVTGRIRPLLSLRYDRIRDGRCEADAACLRGRSVFGFAAGVSWVLRPRR